MLTLWLVATGSHWDVVQVVAWARMFVSNAQEMPLLEAARETFSPEARCGMCHAVLDAKRDSDAGTAIAGKMLFKEPLVIPASGEVIVEAPRSMPWRVAGNAWMGNEREAPPVPPPRSEV
ncbi:MAG: hypothetical protein ACREIA_10105 [Opitutaceae bacterium]